MYMQAAPLIHSPAGQRRKTGDQHKPQSATRADQNAQYTEIRFLSTDSSGLILDTKIATGSLALRPLQLLAV